MLRTTFIRNSPTRLVLPLCGLTLLFSLAFYGHSEVLRGHLGVILTDIDSDRAASLKLDRQGGVEVRSVEENSPADRAGFEAGDVLLTYNSEEILSGLQVGRLVNETPAGRKVKIEYWRHGKTKTAVVTLAASAPRATDDATPNPIAGPAAWNVPDIPRMLMVWQNLALGIEFEPLDGQLAQYFGVPGGVLIRRAEPGFAGERAGLRAGDVITGIDTRLVATPRDLISYLRTEHQPGKILRITVMREHKPRSFTINLGG